MRLSGWIVVAAAAFGAAIVFGWFGNVCTARMISAINRKRGSGRAIPHSGFTPSKTARILREYRLFFPEGRLHLHWWFSLGAVGTSMAICLVSLHLAR